MDKLKVNKEKSVYFIDSSEDSFEKFFLEKERLRVMGRTGSRYFGSEFENGIFTAETSRIDLDLDQHWR